MVVPLLDLLRAGVFEAGTGTFDIARGPGVAAAARHTLLTGLGATFIAVAIGAGAALVTERAAAPGRRWLRLAMILPLLVPPFVTAMSWARAFGPGGLTADLTGWSMPGLFGPAGVTAVIGIHAAPLAYLVVAAALAARAEPDLVRAARASGAGPWPAMRTITLPLLRPALLGAAALSFVSAINSFGIPAILGLPAGFSTVTTSIYRDLSRSANPDAFVGAIVLATGLVALAVLVVGAADRWIGGAPEPARTGAPPGPAATGERRGTAGAAVVWFFIGVTTLLPLTALVLTALTKAVGLSPAPGNWTLANFAEAADARFVAAAGRSALLAVAAATLALALGVLLVSLRRTRAGRALGAVALMTFAVPGSTLAVAVLLAYGPWLRDTLLLILIAYLGKFWAIGHRVVAGSVAGVPADATRAARASGAGPAAALRTVTLPLLRPALGAGWVLVFLFAVHELTMSSLLYGPGTDTLAVVILNLQQIGDLTVTSALAVLLTVPLVIVAVPLLLARRAGPGVVGTE